MWYEQVTVARPMVPERDKEAVERRVFPTEVSTPVPPALVIFLPAYLQARERLTSYRGRMVVKLCWQVNDGPVEVEMRDCGLLPIMVRVSRLAAKMSLYEGPDPLCVVCKM